MILLAEANTNFERARKRVAQVHAVGRLKEGDMGALSVQPTLGISRAHRLAAGIIAAIFLAVAVGAAAYGLIVLVSAAAEILVSVVAAAASLLSAVFAYAFQRAKDLELSAVQKQRELQLLERKLKQENYARILKRLAPYIRHPDSEGDDFTTAVQVEYFPDSPVLWACRFRLLSAGL